LRQHSRKADADATTTFYMHFSPLIKKNSNNLRQKFGFSIMMFNICTSQ